MEDLTPYYAPEVCDGICCGKCEDCFYVYDALAEREKNWEDFKDYYEEEG